jgi:N-acetylmuramoyl-L-alanine amidase
MSVPAVIEKASPNFDDRPAGSPVDMLVLHYTGMKSTDEALDRLCDPATKVSAHYLIDENGTVYGLVPENRRAWHAGLALWRGQRDVNGRSIGIELVNPGHAFGYRDFPVAQMTALTDLALAILARHPIPPRNVVGHSDIAPDRKLDPGERFDWQGLAARGIGLYPATGRPVEGDVRSLLAEYGYDTGARQVIAAFQRHFRPRRVDGKADAETLSILGGLISEIRRTG